MKKWSFFAKSDLVFSAFQCYTITRFTFERWEIHDEKNK